MVSRNLFGTDVNIQIGEGFPSDEEIKQQDNLLSECEHGWIDSTYEDAKLHYRYWLPKGDIKGVVVYFHGINTQSGKALVLNGRRLCTSLLSDTLVGNGLALFSLDLYGHGFSEGTRFWVPSWETNRDDCVKFVKMVSEKHSKDIPLFVAGESYGGCLSVHVGRYFQDHPGSRPANFDSLLLAAPSITADLPPFPTFQFLKYILAPLFPKWTPFFMPHPVNPDRIWRDEQVRNYFTSEDYLRKGLDGGGSTLRLGTALNCVLSLEVVREKVIPGFNIPFCIIHGTEDYAVPIEGSKFLMNQSSTPDVEKELNCIEGAYHDLMGDPLAEESLTHWMKFIDKRIQNYQY